MKQFLLLTLNTLFICQTLFAQQYSIEGTVRNQKNEIISDATISLRNLPDPGSQSLKTVSDNKGFYHFSNLSAGSYLLTATHIGYMETVSDTIHLIPAAGNYTWRFVMNADTSVLQGIVITRKKEVIEIDKGKIVFNIQNDATTTGQTAYDVLKKLPSVTIDQNDNIILRGSSGVNVLIDGKMTYLNGTQLTNYLKGMSAQDISKIEINLTPSAEFDAAGNAGVINIVPKRNMPRGWALDLRSSVTKAAYWIIYENLTFSRRSKNLNLYGSLDFKTPNSLWKNKSGNTVTDSGFIRKLERTGISSTKINYYTWHAGVEWQFTLRQKISIDYLGYFDNFWKNTKTSLAELISPGRKLESSVRTVNNLIEPYHYDGITADYRFDIDSTGKKLTVTGQYISYRNYSDGSLNTKQYDDENNLITENILLTSQPGFRKIKSVKSDLELPFKSFILQTGLKYADVSVDNPVRFDSLKRGISVYIDSLSSHYKYKEQIAAAYVKASKTFKKTSIEAGLRLEYTNASSYTIDRSINNRWEYNNLFPSFSLAQEIGESDKLNISISRRINRPSYGDLNQIRWYVDRFFYYTGNPDLIPEFSWVFSGAYTFKRKYILNITYGVTSNYINRKIIPDSNGYTIKSQFANLGTLHYLDFMASIPMEISTFYKLQFTPVLSFMTYPVSQISGNKAIGGWFTTISLQQQFKLPGDVHADLNTQYFSSTFRGIYRIRGYFYMDLGLKKSFFKKRLDVQVSFNDIFNTTKYSGNSLTDISDYYYIEKPDSRRLGITFQYHFGGDLFKGKTKRSEEQDRL